MSNRINDALGRLNFGTPGDVSDGRLGELMLYIADRCAGDPYYGATTLNKLLYFSDFFAFADRGESITGAEYMTLPQGMVPKRLKYVREKMRAEDALHIRRQKVGRYTQQQVIPLRSPDLDGFSGWEIALVDEIIDLCRGKSATEMSAMTHDRVWEIAGTDKAPIPYQAVYISSKPLTRYDLVRTRELVAEHEHNPDA